LFVLNLCFVWPRFYALLLPASLSSNASALLLGMRSALLLSSPTRRACQLRMRIAKTRTCRTLRRRWKPCRALLIRRLDPRAALQALPAPPSHPEAQGTIFRQSLYLFRTASQHHQFGNRSLGPLGSDHDEGVQDTSGPVSTRHSSACPQTLRSGLFIRATRTPRHGKLPPCRAGGRIPFCPHNARRA
jgi:hypothetical protein